MALVICVTLQKDPGGQGWHECDPEKELYLPLAQSKHLSASDAPKSLLNLPIPHGVHCDVPLLSE